jgi:c-di-GMP phosphodiesterase
VHGGWPCGGPAELFEYAARKSRAVELNRVATVVAIEAAAGLPAGSTVFINVDPPAFNDPRLITDVLSASKRSGLPLDRIVLEVTERSSLVDSVVSTETFEALRAHGVRFALDDHGSAYSHLSTISRIRPSFIKISGVFGTGFESNADKERVIRHVMALAQDFGCATVLEGIESRETAAAAASLGIELAQGYFFSIPRDISHWRGAAA